MSYEVCNKDLDALATREFYNYFNRDSYNLSEQNMHIPQCGNFYLKEQAFNNFYISSCRYNIDKDVKMQEKIDQEMIFLSFMCKGESRLNCHTLENTLSSNTCNLFYLTQEKNIISYLKKGENNEIIDIVFSKNYLQALISRHPGVFGLLHRKLQSRKTFILFDKQLFINTEIYRVLTQLKEAGLMGNSASLYAEVKIMELFLQLLRTTKNENKSRIPLHIREKIHEARYIIELNYLSPLSINELALQVGLCSTALKHYFKQIFNNTVFGYLFDYKMNLACKLLLDTEDTILEVAYQCGYEHASHFATAFKKKYGVTPKEFRNRYK